MDGDIDVLKENSWYVDYEPETGNNFSLSNLVEAKTNIGFSFSIIANLSAKRNWIKFFGFGKR
jgi:hypothetical protein